MEPQDFLALIEQRLGALESRLDLIADRQLTAEVKRTIAIARVDLPFALAKARYVLEIIVRDIYRRERPDAKPKPLFNMIEDLCAQKGLFSAKIATDINYIRINGNLIVHAQDEPVAITDRQVEVIVLMTINLVEWYLTDYLPGRPGARGEAVPELPPPPNPYRGLLAFREEDAPNYFGREADVADVLAAVERQPLVAVVGPSGSGKSSLVQAGVVAQRGTTDGWVVATFRPRGRPYAELAQALVAHWPADPVERLTQAARLAEHWAAAEIPLIDAVHETLRQAGGRRLLLIADQFEEVYTLAPDPALAPGFLDLLVGAVEAAAITAGGQPPVLCLLLTLRADFLSHALGHQGLAAVMDRYPKKLLGPVAEAERLRAIIAQPARRAGVELEDLLVERILRDLAQLPGDDAPGGGASLPLLEFTLAQLWDQQRERWLTHLGYEELGGLQRALSRHADTVYATFSGDDQERVRHVLVQMVRPGEGTADTRQVATRDQVRPENWPLVARLADERLVVTGHDPVRDEDTAELIHEALIPHWPPLREWLRADRAFRLWQNGLRQARAEWERAGRDPGALLAGARLAEAGEYLATDYKRLAAREIAYVNESHRYARNSQRRRIMAVGAVFLILGILSFAAYEAASQLWAYEQRRREEAHRVDLAGTVAAYSTQPGGTALDGVGRNGTYTEALLHHITNPRLSVNEVFLKAHAELINNPMAKLVHQRPEFTTSLNGDVFLQDPPQTRRTFALVIGNSNYLHFPSLKNASNDAIDLSKVLERMGINTNLLLDADKAEILEKIDELIKRIQAVPRPDIAIPSASTTHHRGIKIIEPPSPPNPNVIVILYYSGNGTQIEGQDYIIPVDATENNITNLININDLLRLDLYACVQIVIIDTCRNIKLR